MSSTIATDHTTGQRWAYPLLIALLAASMGVSGAPAPLYGLYEQRWHLAPITTTLVFAAYAAAALLAVLMAGQASDKYGRKPLLLGAAVGMIAGLVVFMTATAWPRCSSRASCTAPRSAPRSSSAAPRCSTCGPTRGARTGHLTGIMINAGIAVTILAASLLAQFAPHPYVAPYAVVAVVILAMLLGLVAMVEPHAGRTGRTSARLRLTRPHVPASIAADFRFAVLGVMAAWSVLGVYLSLFPTFAGQSTGVHSLVFGGAVVAAMAGSAAVSQALGGRLAAKRAAIIGDFGTAAALGVSVLALDSGHAGLVGAAAVFMGLSFGLAFGGSLRHLGSVVPAGQRGQVMSAYYVLGYSAMIVPTILAGWAATVWGLAAIFPWFSLAVALACVTAGTLGLTGRERSLPLVASTRLLRAWIGA